MRGPLAVSGSARRRNARRRRPGAGPGVATPVLLAVVAVLAVMGVRLVVPCDGDPGCFVVAGAEFTDPAEARIPVLTGADDDGYDGQFYWRLSRSPDELGRSAVHGVVLDTPIRVGRPAYPSVVWAASGGGREGLVDWMMILVNVVMTGLLALVLALTARRHGASPWLGAAAALWPGLLFAVGRDLSEPGSAVLVVVGLAAVSRGRLGLAGLAWAGAVLWREQALVVPAAYGCWWLVTCLRRRRWTRPVDVWPWLAPLVAFVSWQAVAARSVGEVPLLASGVQNAVPPLTGLLPEAVRWVRLDAGVVGLVWLAELGVALAVVTAACVVGVRTRRWEVVAVALGAVAILSASNNVWVGPAHLRYATDVVATAWFVLLSPPMHADGTKGHPARTDPAETDPVRGDPPPPRRRRRSAPTGPPGALLAGLVGAQMATAVIAASYLVRTP